MKANRFLLIASTALLLTACGTSKDMTYLETFSPEESTLNMVKITDESNNSVLAGTSSSMPRYLLSANINAARGISQKNSCSWSTNACLALSPDGKKLAYLTRNNGQDNVMVRSTEAQGVATQRTFRDVRSFSWGDDGNIYFSDVNGSNIYICSVSAEQGSMMNQLTNGNVSDIGPTLSADSTTIFFTRTGNGAPSIWSLNRENGTLTSCARGFNQCLIPGDNEAFYCVRNTTSGRSEIWYVNFVKGQESLILSDENKSFTNPQLSPDGKWLLCVGNSMTSKSKKSNLDIYVVRTDGSRLTQLTYHPSNDLCPVWSKDGRSIFFISGRANNTESYNVWRMNFNLN